MSTNSRVNLNKYRKIRVIGGKWKGRQIPIVPQVGMRPTTNVMRETLFNWLDPIIFGAVCLDCFAGSGALGLESLSRGARQVVFVDQSNICIEALIKIASVLNVVSGNIVYADCRIWLKQSIGAYDIVFIDPPFCSNIIIEVINLLEYYNHLKRESWIYIETPRLKNSLNVNMIPYHWYLYRKKITRTAIYYLYLRKG